jgi:sigma-B regulation protein RsbU (phosphoserine phosphatase)
MDQAPLLLIVDDACAVDAAEARARSVLALIDEAHRPPLQVSVVHEVLDQRPRLNAVAAVWLDTCVASPSWLWDVIGAVAEAQVPTLLTRPSESRGGWGRRADDGIVTCPRDAEPAVLAATLGALLSQSPVVRAMRSEIKLLRAHQGGLADQIGRIDEELRLAAQLQREFLPTEMPRIDGVGFGVLWRPASYVSGDIYDVTRLDENNIGFFLADAVGHGVPAALMTVFIKRSLNFKRIDANNSQGYRLVNPGDALAQLNRDMIAQQNGQVRFATACCGVIDCASRTVRLARAGHPYPMILRRDGRREMIEADGGLLGVFEGEAFEQVEVPLEHGDRLLLYSDGFEMAFPEKGNPESGVANTRYEDEFLDLRHGNAEAALDRLRKKLDQQAGSLNQRDDLTIVCLSVDEAMGQSALDPPASAAA